MLVVGQIVMCQTDKLFNMFKTSEYFTANFASKQGEV